MAGIYIPGMEMPDTGSYLVVIDNNTPGKTFITFKRAYDSRQIVGSYEAIPIPDHGRLVDENWLKKAMTTTLEALKKNSKMDGQEMHLIAAFGTLQAIIDAAPTIIPADKEADV